MQGTKLTLERIKAPTPSQALEYYNALKILQSGFPYESGYYDGEIDQAIKNIEDIRTYFLSKITDVNLEH